MGCITLLQGLDVGCTTARVRYRQAVVLVNRGDVDQVRIRSNERRHQINFNLFPDRSGVLFRANGNSQIIDPTFSKVTENSVPFYRHSVPIPVSGTGENVKNLIKQLDAADYFAAVQLYNGDIEIYGFDNGLTSDDYTYRAQSGGGGAVVPLVSRSPEYVPPYLLKASGREGEYFENLFRDLGPVMGGDFNDDFNDDFDIAQAQ